MGDDILKKDVYNVLFLTYQNVGNFEIGVENEIKVDVCVVCIYTRSMHLPLNGKVYGVVRIIYIIGAGSTLLVTPMGFSYDLDRWQVTVDSRVFLLYGMKI